MAVKLPNSTIVYLPELLTLINNESNPLSQRDYLYQYYNKDQTHANVLKSFVELILHPDVQWELPDGSPKFQPTSGYIGQSPSNLFVTFKEVSRFLRGGRGFIQNKDKREVHFITVLESLSKGEAELLCQIKDRNLNGYPNVDMKVFVEAFPEFLPEEVVKDFLEKKTVEVLSTTKPTSLKNTTKSSSKTKAERKIV
jgi:hypothetical protein